jgi:hypothetical protein
MSQNKNLYWLSIIILILSYLSFFLGFILDENSAGGGKIDFEHTLSTVNVFKLGILNAITDIRYESSRPPLFAVLNSLNPFYYSNFSLRLSNFIFSCFIPIFFYLLLKKQSNFDKNIIFFIVSIILLSPYFRTTSFWALEENLPFLFLFISLIFIELNIQKLKKIILVATFSALAVYSDQKFVFLPIFTYLYFLNKNRSLNDFFYISLIYFISSIPFIYLIFQWGSITPPQPSYRFGLNLENLSYITSIIIFYFVPLFIFLILDGQMKFFYKKLTKRNILIFLLILIINLILLPDFKSLWGNGVVSKLSYYLINNLQINLKLIQFLFLIFNSIGIFTIYLILLKNIKNFLPFLVIFVQSSFIQVVHQEYIDPLFYILIFCYFSYDNLTIYKNKLIHIYLVFSLIFLIFANIYYGLIIKV